MKVYLAGTAGNEDIVKEAKPPYILESYLAVKPWQLEYRKHLRGFMLDSGAFSFLNGKRSAIDFERFVDEYSEFVIGHKVELFFEMDVDSTIGFPAVRKLTERLTKRVGRQPIPVWHYPRGKQAFIDMVKEYKYVAIGGLVSKDGPFNAYWPYRWFTYTAHKAGAQIHGLGKTNTAQLREATWDSVDSTTWLNAAIYGNPVWYGAQAKGSMFAVDVSRQNHRRDTQRCKLSPRELLTQNLSAWAQYAWSMDEEVVR